MHQVKPWFTGKLDFAPVLAFGGDDEFPLEGGAVAVVMDRKAAAFVFKRRLHTITVFEVRAEGLPFGDGNENLGRVRAYRTTERGFSVLTWRDGELGYLMVSDVNQDDLHALALRLVGP
jgi:anti-sigma factor RsiW